jgi:xylulokinase
MKKQAVLGLDIGTGSTRGLLVDSSGFVLDGHDVTYPLRHPQPGWAVQHPEQWWVACVEVVRTLSQRADAAGISISALGLSGQQAGLVCLDDQGNVMEDAILWCDNRADTEARALQERNVARGEAARYGGPVTGALWAGKLKWRSDRDLGTPARVMGVKDYIRSRLCPGTPSQTDPVEASVSGLFDVSDGTWVNERVREAGLPLEALPEVGSPDSVAGHLPSSIARDLGLTPGLPVSVGLGDVGTGALGVGAVYDGAEYLGFGSSGITLRAQGEFSPDPHLRVRTCQFLTQTPWFTMGVVQSLGLAWAWWRQILADVGGEIRHADLEDMCRKSQPGAKGLIFLPYLMGEQTPHMDGRIRGGFVGLDISHTTVDMTRAVLEGMAFAMWDAFQVLPGEPDPGPLTVTGKAAQNRLWLETLASLFQRQVKPVSVHEGSAYGAAMIGQALVEALPASEISSRWVAFDESTAVVPPSSTDGLEEAYQKYRDAFPASSMTLR